ncbi:hypothetical protein AAFL31_16480 [Klebsiella huaxiensis]|uniref:hypothetical protein n=1 Tax=Klebsiella huaxiensis TaxID=2153354 RepID=UPI00315E442C
MSGGISAIKGFDYQAAVILDRLFYHFDNHTLSARARPEGLDDLDLSWIEDGAEYRQYIQIKKPTEDLNGNLKPTPWTLSATVRELFPDAIKHLSGNDHSQLWIVGDKFDDVVSILIDSNEEAPVTAPQAYWNVIHRLVQNEVLTTFHFESGLRQKFLHWKVSPFILPDPESSQLALITEFSNFAKGLGVQGEISADYASKVSELHTCLPGILARIEILATYGSEQEVVQRVYGQLEERYSLSHAVIVNTLFRNLRGFINDISKQPGRSFNQEELEFELRHIWPQMIPVKTLPALDPDHVTRRDMVEKFTTKWTGKAIEVIGISGSGKTTLAAEIVERCQITSPDRQVFYAEVRANVSLRDVLVGIAFHLRRQGINNPFAIATRHDRTDEEIVIALANAYSTVPHDILLLIDLVEGSCGIAFSRDLATFIRALSSSSCQIAVFGQESAMRELTSLERDNQGIIRVDIRGFKLNEFVKLVRHYHETPDLTVLSSIYNQITAGRASGLFARLAQLLAREPTLQDMVHIASRPAEDMLAHAEQQRFFRMSKGAQSAAEKLVCFALPFQRKEAEEIFPDENIGIAIRELLTQGLLRYHDKDSFEMHETVRAGLEGLLAADVRRTAHQILAAWYHAQGLVTTEVYHLEKSGNRLEANARARELFLRGEQWSAITAYIYRHNLVSSKDVIDVLAGPHTIEHIFMLNNILRKLGTPKLVSELTTIIEEQKQRYFTDYRWGSAIVETILEFDPAQLHNLITFSIINAQNEHQMASALGWLTLAMHRKGVTVTSDTIEFFNAQPLEIQERLTSLLLRDKHRNSLQAAFKFLTAHPKISRERKNYSSLDYTLRIDSLNETIELLAAIPRVHLTAMLTSKSVLLGPLANLLWSERTKLRVFCIEALKDSASEVVVIENSLRVLIFLAEPSLPDLCDLLLNRNDTIRPFATLCPVLQPTLFEHHRYEAKLFDRHVTLDERFTALHILAYLGADLSNIYNNLKKAEEATERWPAWDLWFLLVASQSPFPEAIAILEKQLNIGENISDNLIIPALIKLGELPGTESTIMLTRALAHSSQAIRNGALFGLTRKRSRSALPALIEQYTQENVEPSVVSIAKAIIASGATSTQDLAGHDTIPDVKLWKCVLAMRSRDIESADWLVSIAVESSNHWQLRRAAIYAAGRLPFTAALERIIPIVMREHSSFPLDNSENLGYHSLISSFLTSGPKWSYVFPKGRVCFINFFAEIIETISSGWIINHDLPSGADAAGWFYDRLSFHGWPIKHDAPVRIINELHIPLLKSAAIRALRLCGQTKLIEQQLATSDQLWIAWKCLTERKRAGNIDSGLKTRLKSFVETSPYRGNTLLHKFISDIPDTPVPPSGMKPVVFTPYDRKIHATHITYTDAVNALSGNVVNFSAQSPLVLENISFEECQHLIRLADPSNNPDHGIETYIPMIKFTSNSHLVAQHQWTSTNSGAPIHSLIRPAIVAANHFGLPIPWQNELMTRVWSDSFVREYLTCLSALNDSSQFYEMLSKYEDILITYLCNQDKNGPVRKFIDERIIPTLMRYVSSGTDETFEGLCMLTLLINTPKIEPVLLGLLYRWAQHFDNNSSISQHYINHHLWRGFSLLTEHPRFTSINDWMDLLEKVLQTPINRFYAQHIIRVLESDPRSYILIESRLLTEENWEHYRQEEIDRLDDAAEKMFQRVSDLIVS